MTAGDIRPGARGGRAARRAYKMEQEADYLKAHGALSREQMIHEQSWAEKVNCPICRQAVHPTNWKAHMELKHPEQDIPLHEVEPGRLALTMIRRDGGTQPRLQMESEVTRDYADAMSAGVQFPAVIVFYDGQDYWLADGFHRVAAAQWAGLTDINAEVRQGTQRDAILFSVGANASHGLRRTNADKRRAVERLLSDDEWAKWTNREIARRCAVSPDLVDRTRRSLPESGSDTRTYTTKHGTTATMHTGNIGKSQPVQPHSNGQQMEDDPATPPTMPETDEQKRAAALGGKGAKVQHRHSGQIGTLLFMHGNVAYVDTVNGQKAYHWQYLKKVEDAPTEPPKHWGLSNGMAFWTQVHKFKLDRETILEQLQPDAKVLTDLRMTRDDAWVKLNQIATERTANLFPVGSYVKADYGSFGEVKQAHAYLIRVFDFTLKSEATWYIDKCHPATETEYLASLEEEKPKPAATPSYADLPERQVEFLLDLANGRPVNKNAATRMALRGHALITFEDDWSAIKLTDAGELWLGVRDLLPKSYNYKRDNKSTRPADETKSQPFDFCQTPPYALDPLLPYLVGDPAIWEPAAGEGLLVEALHDSGFNNVIATDILTGENFLEYEPSDFFDLIVTNPPFSLKFDWLKRCYQLGKPFALLLPVETLGTKTAQDMFREYGVEIILMDKRVNFKMPNKGWDGAGAQFPVAWFTWGLNIGSQITFARLESNDDPE